MDAFCSVFYHYSIVYQYCKGKKSGNVFTNSEQSYFSLCFVSGKNHYLSVHLFIAVLRDCFGSKIGFSLFESTRFRIVVFQIIIDVCNDTFGRIYSNFFRNIRSEEHTSELQSRPHLVCRLLLEKKKKNILLLPH